MSSRFGILIQLFLLLFFFSQLELLAQNRRFIWAAGLNMPGAGTNLYNGLKTDIYGNHYTIGRNYQFSPDKTIYSVIKLNKNGTRVWTQNFSAGNVTLPLVGEPKSVVHTYPDSSSTYIMCLAETILFNNLSSTVPIGNDMIAFNLDKDGNLMWWCQFGASGDENLIETFENSDSDIVIHGLTRFSSNKFYFQRPVNGVLVKDSTVFSAFSNYDYYFTLKKDGTAGPLARVLNSNIEFATLLGSFPLPGNKIELIVRTNADLSSKAKVKRWIMNGDGTGLAAAPESLELKYATSGGRLDFGNVLKTSSGSYLTNTYSNSSYTLVGLDTFSNKINYLTLISNDLSTTRKKLISAPASSLHFTGDTVLWTSETVTRLIVGSDTIKNQNNQFAQHFIITNPNLQLLDSFQIINANASTRLKNAWINDSLEVTCMYTQQYDTWLDTIYLKGANKSWYHYSILGKRARRNISNIPTSLWDFTSVDKGISVYPNPIRSGQNLWLNKLPNSIQAIRLISLEGRVLQTWNTRTNMVTIPDIKEGLYLLHVIQTDGKITLGKVFVAH